MLHWHREGGPAVVVAHSRPVHLRHSPQKKTGSGEGQKMEGLPDDVLRPCWARPTRGNYAATCGRFRRLPCCPPAPKSPSPTFSRQLPALLDWVAANGHVPNRARSSSGDGRTPAPGPHPPWRPGKDKPTQCYDCHLRATPPSSDGSATASSLPITRTLRCAWHRLDSLAFGHGLASWTRHCTHRRRARTRAVSSFGHRRAWEITRRERVGASQPFCACTRLGMIRPCAEEAAMVTCVLEWLHAHNAPWSRRFLWMRGRIPAPAVRWLENGYLPPG